MRAAAALSEYGVLASEGAQPSKLMAACSSPFAALNKALLSPTESGALLLIDRQSPDSSPRASAAAAPPRPAHCSKLLQLRRRRPRS